MAAWVVASLLLLADLRGDLQQIVVRSGVEPERVGIAVGSLDAQPLYRHGAGVARIPASNQKLLTAAVAILKLGADFEFATRVGLTPEGHLVVVGDGDPNFSGRWFDGDPNVVLRRFARDVARRGVTEIKGDLVLDAGRFDDVWIHPDWPRDQLEKWYCAPVAALLYNDSCWDVTVRPGATPGALARVRVEPALAQPPLDNHCRTVDRSREHVVHVGRGREQGLVVRGGILAGSEGVAANVTVPDPVLFFGEAFHAALRAEGIEVRGRVRRGRGRKLKAEVVYRSPLERTLVSLLTNSQNLYAEALYKRAGDGTFAGSGRIVLEVLKSNGVPTEGLVVADGSGLARSNRVTAATLYAVLRLMAERELFVNALAAPGEGTLRKRLRDLEGGVRLKTGTLSGVTALSGYVTDRSGDRRIMVVLYNGPRTRKARLLQDAIARRLADEP